MTLDIRTNNYTDAATLLRWSLKHCPKLFASIYGFCTSYSWWTAAQQTQHRDYKELTIYKYNKFGCDKGIDYD